MGDRILNLLKKNQITQIEFARIINVAPSTLNGYIKGTRLPDYDTLIAITSYFSVSVDYLLGLEVGQTLSNDEKKLLKKFRSLSERDKQILIGIADLIDKK